MNITLNEYIHVDRSFYNEDGRFVAIYEPANNGIITSIHFEVYLGLLPAGFAMGSSGRFADYRNMDELPYWVEFGEYGLRNSVITLVWNDDPGDHFLLASYEYDENAIILDMARSDINTVGRTINWLKEGF